MKNVYLNDTQIHDNTANIGIWLRPKIMGLDSPSIRLPSFERPNIDGAFVPNQLYGGRSITLEGKVSGDGDVNTYRSRRRALELIARIYRPGGILQPLTLKFKTMDDLELQAQVYVKKLKFDDQEMTFGEYQLDLFAPDIRLLSQSEHQQQMNIFSGGGMPIAMPIPMSMAAGGLIETQIENLGSIGAFPFITIFGTIENPTITNQTTGEAFSLTYTLTTAAQFITVDVENRTVLYYADETTAPVNIRDKFSGDWFEIASGVNSLKLVVADNADTGYALIVWRDAYLGV